MRKIEILTTMGDRIVIEASFAQNVWDAVSNALQNLGLHLGYLSEFKCL